jgi:murein hydrolase activator
MSEYRKITILAIAIFVGMPIIFAFAEPQSGGQIDSVIQTRKVELDKIKEQLSQKKQRLQTLEKEEKNQLEKLNAIEDDLNLNNQLLAKINRQLADYKQRLETAENQLKVSQNDLTNRQQIMNDRLVWIYKRSVISPTFSVFGAENLLQGVRRAYYFSLLNRYDKNMLAQINRLSKDVAKNKETLLQRQSAIAELHDDKQNQVDITKGQQKKWKSLLSQVRRQKESQKQSIEGLEDTQNKISGIIGNLAEKRKAISATETSEFSKLKGKLAWPVEGKIIQTFGKVVDKRYSTTLLNAGIDIGATIGADVTAAAAGEVVHISWLRGYGSFIILDHGGGFYSLYAHLDEIDVELEQKILPGEKIGTVGESGSLTGPQLHFEIRQGKEQLDPEEWLR